MPTKGVSVDHDTNIYIDDNASLTCLIYADIMPCDVRFGAQDI
jgi:hypothetical protein